MAGLKKVYLGIDLGGSNISVALANVAGKIIGFDRIETLAHRGPEQIIDHIIKLAKQLQKSENIPSSVLQAVGVGVPGVLNYTTGVVRFSPNLPGWINIPLRQKLRSAFKKTVVVDNDANVAAYGEKWQGAGKKYNHVVVYTLGTGVGGGIILNGKIFHGSSGGAGELGHTTILPEGPLCACGNRGCLETLVSGAAIGRAGREALQDGNKSLLRELCEDQPENITAKTVFQAARKGDAVAKEIIRRTGKYLGIAIAGIINLLNPEIVIIGGGVSISGRDLLPYVEAEVKKRTMKALAECTRIVTAELADKAGVMGAVGIAIQAGSKSTSK